MFFALVLSAHILAATVWVGGMFFAFMVLRPVTGELDVAVRLNLWSQVLKRFFAWVWLAILLLLATGYLMIFTFYGGFASSGMHIHIMHAIGLLMMLLFLHLFFAPFRRLGKAVAAQDWPLAGQQLGQIRLIVGINLILGLITICIAAAGLHVFEALAS